MFLPPTVYDDAYVFEEFPLDAFCERADPNALALVRDDQGLAGGMMSLTPRRAL